MTANIVTPRSLVSAIKVWIRETQDRCPAGVHLEVVQPLGQENPVIYAKTDEHWVAAEVPDWFFEQEWKNAEQVANAIVQWMGAESVSMFYHLTIMDHIHNDNKEDGSFA